MNFKCLTNENLIENLVGLVRDERKVTAQIIKCIYEIDRRNLYLQRGHSSLFDFLTKHFGYSPGSAMRRIDAARLLNEIPETLEKIEEGSLTLAQVTQVQRASRELLKNKKEVLTTGQKRDLFRKLENKSQKDSEKLIAVVLDFPTPEAKKEIIHRDQSVTMTVTFSEEQIKRLELVKGMISHAVPNSSWSEVIAYLVEKEIKRRTPVVNSKKGSTHYSILERKPVIENRSLTSPANQRPSLPAKLRNGLLNENATCAFVDPNGNRCNSTRFLQIDHIQSWSRGGSHSPENLQVLCGAHNRWKYLMERR